MKMKASLPIESLPERVWITKKQILDSVPGDSQRCAISQAFQKQLEIFHPDTVHMTFDFLYFRINGQERHVSLGHGVRGWLAVYECDPKAAPRIRLELRKDLLSLGEKYLYYQLSS